MALDPGTQFNEAGLTAAEFDPQDKVLPNSPIESNDVNAIASRALRRTAYLRKFSLAETTLAYAATFTNNVAPYTLGGPLSSATYVDTTFYVDIADTKAGDYLQLDISGTWQLNSPSTPAVVGQLRMQATDDLSGAAVVTTMNGSVAIVEQSTGVNATMSFAFAANHVVQNDGTSRVRAQVRYLDTSGGAGTATLVFLFAARLDVLHMKRS